MIHGIARTPPPVNEPVRSYAPGSSERTSLKRRLEAMYSEVIDIPLILGGEEVRTGDLLEVVCPHEHGHVLARCHQAGPAEIERAIHCSLEAWREWSETPWEERAAVFLKAAELLAGPWRDTLNAATMLGQSKTVYQAEIDSACEIIDFWRFNSHYLRLMYAEQPISPLGTWNQLEYRPLEGFVFAVTPFNFTSIGANLPTAPALMGNTVVWKPASTSVFANYYTMKLLETAGLPPGVINFLPGKGSQVGSTVFRHRELAGLHFTGSTVTFRGMWRAIAENLGNYRSYPRIVGETGGKDFVFAHPSADLQALTVALVRGAFEYQGQKCSAASRAYIPRSLWPELQERLGAELAQLKMGSPLDFQNFLCAVIDRPAFEQTMRYIDLGRNSSSTRVLFGGKGDDSVGYFVEPTVILSEDPKHQLMQEEIFAPVLTVYVYEDSRFEETLELCDTTSPYALTGAIFARDRRAIGKMLRALRHAAGNFYINDKPTGAVVGQQPFGGARASGTNDKAGAPANLMRWVSLRAIKENFVPPLQVAYPHQAEP